MDENTEQQVVIQINSNIKKTTNTFDYLLFFKSSNQSEYFKNYMYSLCNGIDDDLKYFTIKRQMRNLDWNFLSSCGLLQQNFITCVITTDQLAQNGIVPFTVKDIYLPIKIFHYLKPQLLCKYNNLSSYEYEQYSSSSSSDSSSSFSSDSSNSSNSINNIIFLDKYIDFINKDKKEYYENSQKIKNPQNYGNNSVHRYDFLQNSISEYYGDCSLYSVRSYDKPYTNNDKSFSFWTNDKKYIGSIDIVYDDYQLNDKNELQVTKKTKSTEYITNQLRRVGVNKEQILKNQNITLQFALDHYTIDQICRYYKFSEQQLNFYKDGLLLKDSIQYTPYNFQILFKYQDFDTNNSYFKSFYIHNKESFTSTILDIFGTYQKISYEITDNKIIPTDNVTYDNLTIYENEQYKSSYIKTLGYSQYKQNALFPYTKHFLSTNNEWFTNPTVRYNYGSIRGKDQSSYYKYIYDITTQNDFVTKRSDTIITTNVTEDNKIQMLKLIDQAQGNYSEQDNQIINVKVYYPNNQWYNSNNGSLYEDQEGKKYLKLFIKKYDYYYVGKSLEYDSDFEYYHSKCYFEQGLNICDKKFTENKDYFIVGTQPLMFNLYNAGSDNILQVKVYIQDIIAILDNKCLATKKIYVE